MKPLATLLLSLSLLTSQGPQLPPPKPDPRIAEHLPLARAMAHKFLPSMGGLLELDDLVSIAMAAMWEDLPGFDEARGLKFGQYARVCMHSALRNQQRNVWRKHRRSWLEQESIHPYTDDDRGIDLPSPGRSPEELADVSISVAELQRAMPVLTPRQQEVLRRRFWEEDLLEDVGAGLRLTRERVRQIQDEAVARLGRTLRRERVIDSAKKSTLRQQVVIDESGGEVHLLDAKFVEPVPTTSKQRPL